MEYTRIHKVRIVGIIHEYYDYCLKYGLNPNKMYAVEKHINSNKDPYLKNLLIRSITTYYNTYLIDKFCSIRYNSIKFHSVVYDFKCDKYKYKFMIECSMIIPYENILNDDNIQL